MIEHYQPITRHEDHERHDYALRDRRGQHALYRGHVRHDRDGHHALYLGHVRHGHHALYRGHVRHGRHGHRALYLGHGHHDRRGHHGHVLQTMHFHGISKVWFRFDPITLLSQHSAKEYQ